MVKIFLMRSAVKLRVFIAILRGETVEAGAFTNEDFFGKKISFVLLSAVYSSAIYNRVD